MDTPATLNKLEDVPLPANAQQQQANDEGLDDEAQNVVLPSLAKPNSRTNSLKRFFKMNKKGDKETTEPAEEDNMASKSDNNFAKGIGKKFHLRLGHFNKHVNAEAEAAKPSTAAAVTGATPKHTLKGSLSNYWNALFKKGKKQSGDADADSVSSAASEAEDEVEEGKHEKTADDTGDDSSSRGNATNNSAEHEKNIVDNLTSVANEIHTLTVCDIDTKDVA